MELLCRADRFFLGLTASELFHYVRHLPTSRLFPTGVICLGVYAALTMASCVEKSSCDWDERHRPTRYSRAMGQTGSGSCDLASHVTRPAVRQDGRGPGQQPWCRHGAADRASSTAGSASRSPDANPAGRRVLAMPPPTGHQARLQKDGMCQRPAVPPS